MPTDFYVAPLGGLDLGQAIGNAVTGGEARYRQMQIKKQMPEVLKSNDPDKMYEFISEYPEAKQMVQEAIGFKEDAKIKARVDTAKQVLASGDPVKVYEEMAKATQGKDPQILDWLGESLQDKSAAIARAERVIALNAPDVYDSYKSMFPEKSADKDGRSALQKEYDLATSQGYSGTFLEYQKAIKNLDEGSITSEDKYVKDREAEWQAANPEASVPAGKQADWRLEYKRAQAPEVGATKRAGLLQELGLGRAIELEKAMGKIEAEIKTSRDKIHSEGKLTEDEQKYNARLSATDIISKLANTYTKLNEVKGIVNPDNSWTDNAAAYFMSSNVGQKVGTALGTEAQSLRNFINSQKPGLVQELRQVADMGTRGMDSEKELEFYLNALSSEKSDVKANLAALIMLDNKIGLGLVNKELRDTLPATMLSTMETAAGNYASNEIARLKKLGVPYTLDNPSRYGESTTAAATRAAPQQYPEGTIIRNQSGARMVMRNGTWEAM